MANVWTDGWEARVRAMLNQMGYDDGFAFVMAHPGKSFGELFGMLRRASGDEGRSFAFIQLQEIFFIDARSRCALRDALIESFTRTIAAFGFKTRKSSRGRPVVPCTEMPLPCFESERWFRLQDRLWAELASMQLPDNWRPKSADDPIVTECFGRIWPIVNESDRNEWRDE